MLYACDPKWWKWHEDNELLIKFPGDKYTQHQNWTDAERDRIFKKHKITMLSSAPERGLSVEPGKVHTGGNGGYQAINLAYLLGARRIVLIGYDMQVGADGRAHWFGHHPDKVISNHQGWIAGYKTLATHAKKLGLEIINATPTTALTCFNKMKLDDAI